jgi:hypothetical protein
VTCSVAVSYLVYMPGLFSEEGEMPLSRSMRPLLGTIYSTHRGRQPLSEINILFLFVNGFGGESPIAITYGTSADWSFAQTL